MSKKLIGKPQTTDKPTRFMSIWGVFWGIIHVATWTTAALIFIIITITNWAVSATYVLNNYCANLECANAIMFGNNLIRFAVICTLIGFVAFGFKHIKRKQPYV